MNDIRVEIKSLHLVGDAAHGDAEVASGTVEDQREFVEMGWIDGDLFVELWEEGAEHGGTVRRDISRARRARLMSLPEHWIRIKQWFQHPINRLAHFLSRYKRRNRFHKRSPLIGCHRACPLIHDPNVEPPPAGKDLEPLFEPIIIQNILEHHLSGIHKGVPTLGTRLFARPTITNASSVIVLCIEIHIDKELSIGHMRFVGNVLVLEILSLRLAWVLWILKVTIGENGPKLQSIQLGICQLGGDIVDGVVDIKARLGVETYFPTSQVKEATTCAQLMDQDGCCEREPFDVKCSNGCVSG